MNNKMKKIVLSIVAIAVLAFGIFYFASPKTADSLGMVKVELVNLEGEEVKTVESQFVEEDTLVGIVENNFENVVIENGMILAMEDYVTPEDWSTFLAIYTNGEMSMVGIEEIVLEDGLEVSFVVTEFVNE